MGFGYRQSEMSLKPDPSRTYGKSKKRVTFIACVGMHVLFCSYYLYWLVLTSL